MKSALFLLFLINTFEAAFAQQHVRDSLEILLRQTNLQDTNRVKTLNRASEAYWSNNPQKAKQYAEDAIRLAQKLNFGVAIGTAYLNLGIAYWSQGKYQAAIQEINTSLHQYERINNLRGIAGCYNNLGLCQRSQGDFSQAITYYFKALKIHEKQGNLLPQAQLYNNIGLVFKFQEKYDQALYYYWQAYHKYVNREPRGQAGVLDNIGNIYLLKKEYAKAISYLNQSRVQFATLKEPLGLVICDTDLGRAYTATHQYDLAETYFRRARQIGETVGYNPGILSSLLGLGEIRLKTSRATESFEFFNKALTLATQLKQQDGRMRSYAGLATAYGKTGNFAKAYDYQSKWVALKDSAFNEESAKKIARVQAEFEFEKKQAEIELLKKDQQVSRLWRNTVGAGLLALLIIAGLVVSRQRLKIRQDQVLLAQSRLVAEKNEQLEKQTHQLEEQAGTLAAQARQLQDLDEAKSRFFANISHEFRTPLTLIIGTLSEKLHRLANQPEIAISQPEIKVMHHNGQRLLQLINQLLDLSKIESGRMEVELQPADIKPLLEVVTASFASLADQRQIRLAVHLSADPLPVLQDADQLEKVVTNLLSNAFKFTPDGGQIALTAGPITVDGKSFVQLVVEDTGIGIAPEQIERVFDRFYQGKAAPATRQPGTGIGLSLVKELVLLHNGTIQVENNVGLGARFSVLLPRAEWITGGIEWPIATSALGVNPFVEISSALPVAIDEKEERPLLLIVEDHGDLRVFIRNQMQRYYRVLESENGLQALTIAQENLPDLIISDWMMPDMDGIEFCSRIKTDERTSHIPFILLTALSTQDNKLTGLETGADDYLTKPFDSRELAIRVQNLIDSRRKLRDKFGREIRLQPKDITVTSADEKFLVRVMKIVEDNLDNADFTPEQFGREVGLSRMQLHRKLIALTGLAASDFIRNIRLKRAAQLLEGRTGNVSEIAYSVGFNSPSYFSKCFKVQFGVLPNEYGMLIVK